GQMLIVDLDRPGLTSSCYWDIPPEQTQTYSDRQWEELLDEKLKDCVRRQLVSDVPLGAFLSGGVDSSLLVSAMGATETFSIGFAEESYNELGYSRRVADHLGQNHITEIIKPDVVALFDTLMYSMDDPIGDFSIFPTYLVSQLARKHVTVSLSGDGGDELFGGYETYLANRYAGVYRRVPLLLRSHVLRPLIDCLKPTGKKKGFINKLKRFVEGANLPENMEHARWRMFLNEAMMQQLFTPDAYRQITRPPGGHIETLFQGAGERGALNRCLYVDFKSYLPDNILVKVDRMSMAVSLESRVPYLDKELVELAFQVPDRLKIAGRETKSVLKRLAARYIPKECVYRPKEGFSIPIKHWLNTQFKPLMEDYLDEQRLRRQGIFNVDTIKTLQHQHRAGFANHSHILWALIVFQAWHRRWMEAC
ncbi:MAG: asparagine synthetase B family protein, partial [Nitrospiria bacterium]